MLKGLSVHAATSIRPAYLIAVGVLFVLVTAGLLKAAGILPESTWSWASAPRPRGDPSDLVFQSALDASLRQSEERIQAKLQHLLQQDNNVTRPPPATAPGLPGSGDIDAAAAYPNSDVSKLLAKYPAGSSESKELRKHRYCRGDGSNYTVPPASRIAWAPAPGKFLLTLCDYGQISNRLNCFRWYMLLAALLNRTLVMPEREAPPKGYAYHLVFDVDHARGCIASSNVNASEEQQQPTVVTLQEYLESSRDGLWEQGKQVKNAVLDSVWCWRDRCVLEGYGRMFPGVTMPSTVSGTEYRAKIASVAALVREFGSLPDAMISFGNLFGLRRLAGLPPEAYSAPNLPVGAAGQTCRLLIQPHQALVLAAKGFVKTILGSRYMAVHLRRGDFHHFWGPYCRRMEGCKIVSVAAIADCILEKLEGTGIDIVYLATNAKPTELALLESVLRANPRGGAPVTLLRAPPALGQEDYFWAASWKRMKLDDVPLAHATLDKLLCAMAKLFMGSAGSTFTDDIVAMRAGLGTLTCQDQPVCAVYAVRPQDQLPDFNITFTDPYQGTRHY